jgi:hypothetical protein
MGEISTSTKQAKFKLPGLPGMALNLILQAGYKDAASLKNVSNLPGQYKVLFTMHKPNYAISPERMLSSSQLLEGDSYLAISSPALTYADGKPYDYDLLRFEAKTVNGDFVFIGRPNKRGMLSTIETEPFDAQHFGDAAVRALHAVSPTLSALSTALDVPVSVYQMEVIEVRTDTRRWTVNVPFNDVYGALPPLSDVSPEEQKYLSLYREALNSNSPNYSYLCFYRIIEGLRDRRQRLRAIEIQDALQKGKEPVQPDEFVPSDPDEQRRWLDRLYVTAQNWDDFALRVVFIDEVINKRVRHVIDKGQRLHDLRNKIAHAVVDSGEETISIDSGRDIEEVQKWLPIAKFVARYLLIDSFPRLLESE